MIIKLGSSRNCCSWRFLHAISTWITWLLLLVYNCKATTYCNSCSYYCYIQYTYMLYCRLLLINFTKKIFKAKWTFVYDWIHRLFFIYSCSYNQFIYAILLLKYGSEEKGSSLCRCSILLGFIMSKNLRGLWFYLLIKVQNATSLVFLT